MTTETETTAAPSSLEAAKAALRATLEHYLDQANKIETALSVLEQVFPLNGASSAESSALKASQASELVLNQTGAELLSAPSALPAAPQRKSRKSASPATTEVSGAPEGEPAEQKPSEVAVPKAAAPKGESFSLVGRLRATYQKYDGLSAAIVSALNKFDGAVEVPDLVDELYGRNLRKAFQPRAIGALTRQLNKGAKDGLWQSIEGQAGEAPAFAALD